MMVTATGTQLLLLLKNMMVAAIGTQLLLLLRTTAWVQSLMPKRQEGAFESRSD